MPVSLGNEKGFGKQAKTFVSPLLVIPLSEKYGLKKVQLGVSFNDF